MRNSDMRHAVGKWSCCSTILKPGSLGLWPGSLRNASPQSRLVEAEEDEQQQKLKLLTNVTYRSFTANNHDIFETNFSQSCTSLIGDAHIQYVLKSNQELIDGTVTGTPII